MEKTKIDTYIRGFLAFVVFLAVLKAAKTIIMPAVISVFIALLLMPLIRFLTKKKVPLVVSAFLSLLMVVSMLFLITQLFMVSLKSLTSQIPFYTEKFKLLAATAIAYLENYGLKLELSQILHEINPSAVAGIFGKSMLSVVTVLSNLLLIFFITLFLLIESARFQEKAKRAFGENHILPASFRAIDEEIMRYVTWKTLISMGTGVCVWVFLSIVGVDFALLWGLVAFFLNFIPSIGSIIASVPPVLIALLQFERPILYGIIVLAGLAAIQLFIGSFLDPKLVGRSLNLSALVIFLSMIFWGWMWGVPGMILAVPLMVCVKAVFSRVEALRPIAIMMEG